jgi:hypothetical protein
MVGENNQDAVMEELLLWLAILVRQYRSESFDCNKNYGQ